MRSGIERRARAAEGPEVSAPMALSQAAGGDLCSRALCRHRGRLWVSRYLKRELILFMNVVQVRKTVEAHSKIVIKHHPQRVH